MSKWSGPIRCFHKCLKTSYEPKLQHILKKKTLMAGWLSRCRTPVEFLPECYPIKYIGWVFKGYESWHMQMYVIIHFQSHWLKIHSVMIIGLAFIRSILVLGWTLLPRVIQLCCPFLVGCLLLLWKVCSQREVPEITYNGQ